ncbi:SAM domain-containing protein SAMSN-1 isoform X3 [Crotalus tigris]|nr:SAM domain-containing protein SAMSN-1 isoform X3 [Crotalus tigris]
MDSLYEPVKENQELQEDICMSSRANTPECANAENTAIKERKFIQEPLSENEVFEKNEDFLIEQKSYLLQESRKEETACHVTDSDENQAETMGTLKRLQKLVRNKKDSIHSLDDMKHILSSNISPQDPGFSEAEAEVPISCMKLTKYQDKKILKESTRLKAEFQPRTDLISALLDTTYLSGINNLENNDTCSEMEFQLWSDWKIFSDSQLGPCDFFTTRIEEWGKCTCCSHQSQLTSSVTDVDLPSSWRSSSFGKFDHRRHHSTSKPNDSSELDEVCATCDGTELRQNKPNNGGSIGKKMRAISMTMKKKMGKKYIRVLSEEMNEGAKSFSTSNRDSDPGGEPTTASMKASDSMDSLYSLNSGQSSSSGVTCCSDATSNRDSLKFDEEISYVGPFCGRARVHTDFTPSPYDSDSLKIKKGDIIDIICKTPMGMWTGLLNNKVGNFKFIYVDLITEEESAPRKIKPHKKSKRAKPNSLQEFLEQIHLQDYLSTLLLNGYQTLEDLKDLHEKHLIELNIKDPEDRTRLLLAIENLQDSENEQDQETEPMPQMLNPNLSLNKLQLNERDSGCYISPEMSDNSKEDLDAENLPDVIQKISITESD